MTLFFGAFSASNAQCSYTLTLNDSWGDGWNGNTMDVWVAGTVTNYTLTTGSTISYNIAANYGDSVAFIWQNGGSYTAECTFEVTDGSGTILHTSPNGAAMTIGAVEYGQSCAAPTCTWQVTLLDSWGDGWNGNTIDIYAGGTTTNYTIASGSVNVIPLNITAGDSLALTWQGGGSYASECSYEVADNAGNVVYTSGSGSTMTVGAIDFSTTMNCVTGPNPCLVSTFPFTEDFETWSGTVPACWNGIKTSTSGWGWTLDGFGTGSSNTGPAAGNSGDFYVYLETSSSGSPAEALLPPFDLTSVFNPQVKFFYHKYGATQGDLSVEVSTDGKVTWTTLKTISGQTQFADTDPYIEDSVSLVGNATAETWIRFVGSYGGSFTGDMAIDDIYVGDGPLCPGPGGVMVSNITGSGADVSWTSLAADHKLEYGPAGYTQGTGTLVSPATSPVTLSGLSGATTYDVYVQDSCDATHVVWVGPYTFTTLQSTVTLPYLENFETTNGGFLTGGANSSWEWGAPAGAYIPNAGQGSLAWVTNLDGNYNSNELSYLYTPYFDGTSSTFDLVYEFQSAFYTENGWDEAWVEYSFDDVTWTKLVGDASAIGWYNDLGNQWWESLDTVWSQRRAVIPGSAGEVVHVRHIMSSDGIFEFEGVAIDEVQAYEIPCEFPVQNLAVSNVTSSSFDVHWTSNSTSWEIETGPIGYGQATGVGTITLVTNDTATVSINACDSVDLYVRAVCGATNSPWVGPITVGALCEYDVKLSNLLVDVNTCGDSATSVYAVIENKGLFDLVGIPVHADITGGLTASLSNTYTDTLASGTSDTLMVGTFNSYNGAIGVDINGYTALSTDQYSTNDSIVIGGVAYIGPTPVVADIDTVCSTDATGTFYAEHIDGLRYGWYASTTDTIAAGIGDSFTIPMSGQLTWYLGYEKPLSYLETTFLSNNGGSYGNAFSVLPNISTTITGFDINSSAIAGSNILVYIEYLMDTVDATNNASTAGWIVHDTVAVVAAGSGLPTYVPLSSPLVLQGGQMAGLRIGSSSGLRYTNGTTVGTPFVSDAQMTIYQGWGLTGSFSPRNWNGRIYYDSGDKCSETRIPVTMGIYADTAQADFTYTILADGYTVFFDATNSVADEFMWDFNDGTVGYGDTITHTFADSVDAYAVCLFVDDTVCMTSDMMCDAVVTTIGLEESMLNASLNIYPNPTAGAFNIEFTAVTNTNYSIEILDVSGRAISTKTGETQYGKNNVQMNASLANGVYMIKTIVGDQVNVSRLVVRH